MTVEEVIEQCTAHELVDLMVQMGWTKSKGEGRRLIAQGGIRINDEKVTDPNTWLFVKPDGTGYYQLGIDMGKLHATAVT